MHAREVIAETVQKKRTGNAFAPVLSDAAYTLDLLRAVTGLDEWALRTAQREGLRTVKVGRRKFVIGSDFIDYLKLKADQPSTAAIA